MYGIFLKREFQMNRSYDIDLKNVQGIKEYRDTMCNKKTNMNSTMRNHQNIVSHYINPETPYKGLLLFHGTGSGKTCAAIGVAENFKSQVEKYNTKVYVLVSGPILKRQFRNEIILSCTDTYLDKVEFSNSSDERKRQMYANAINKIKNYYQILSYKSFYRRVLGEKIKKGVTDKFSKEVEREISYNQIVNMNNSVLIIDEAHHFTGKNNEYGNALRKIIKNSVNLRLILLTATPMQNICSSIVDILNFLRPLDSQIKESDIFQGNDYTTTLRENGRELLEKYSQGYVSYFKGNDPYLFAKRNEMGDIPSFLKFTHINRIPMSSFQFKVYKENLNKLEIDSLGRSFQTISNFVFPIVNEKNELSGTSNETDLLILKNLLDNNKKKYYSLLKKRLFRNRIEKDFSINVSENLEVEGNVFHKCYLQYFSPKFLSVLKNITRNNEGVSFVYSNFVKTGVSLFRQVLLKNGFLEYSSKFSERNINEDTLDHTLTTTYGEWRRKNRSSENSFYPAFFISLTGSDNITSKKEVEETNNSEEKLDAVFNIFNDEKNKDGKFIKLILGSKVINEGFTFYNIRNIHIIDTWYTLGLVDQVIGRGIRDCKHYELMSDNNFYPKVNVFKYVSSIPGHNSSVLSKDEELYQKAEKKYTEVKRVERILIENAIDCPINYNLNVIKNNKFSKCNSILDTKKGHTRKTCPPECQFQNCLYKCNSVTLNKNYYNPKRHIYDIVLLRDIDNSSYYKSIMNIEVKKCINEIKKRYIFRSLYSYKQIYEFVKASYHVNQQYLFDEFYLQKALDKLTPVNEKDFVYFNEHIYNIYRQPGYLFYNKNNLFEFRIIESKSEDIFDLSNTDITINKILGNRVLKKKVDNSNIYDYDKTKYYYSKREENEIVGVIVKNDLFNMRKKRNFNTKLREKGLSTEMGGNCITVFPKKKLLAILQKYNSKKNWKKENLSKEKLCFHLRNTFLHLEKTNKKKKTYVIIPYNHPIYVFPYNIYSRKEYIAEKLNRDVKMTDSYYEVRFKSDESISQYSSILRRYSFVKENSTTWRSRF